MNVPTTINKTLMLHQLWLVSVLFFICKFSSSSSVAAAAISTTTTTTRHQHQRSVLERWNDHQQRFLPPSKNRSPPFIEVLPPTSVPSKSPSHAPTESVQPSISLSAAPAYAPTSSSLPSTSFPSTSFPSRSPEEEEDETSSSIPTDGPNNTYSPTRLPDDAIHRPSFGPTLGPTTAIPTPVATGPNNEGDISPHIVSSGTSVYCENSSISLDEKEEFWFQYSVDLVEGKQHDLTNSINQFLEPTILEFIQDDLLLCDNANRIGIAAMDYYPADVQIGEDCPEPKSNRYCYVYLGLMYLYLEPGSDLNLAIYEARVAIWNLMMQMQDSLLMHESLSSAGITRVVYMAPDLNITTATVENNTPGGSMGSSFEENSSDSVSSGILILVAFTSLSLIILFASGYRYRQTRKGGGEGKQGDEETPTLASISHITGTSGETTTTATTLPHGHLLPVYTSRDQTTLVGGGLRGETMSAILESDNEGDSQSAMSLGIVVSESGYTDDSQDNSYLQTLQMLLEEPVLGAHARRTEDFDNNHNNDFGDIMFDTGSDFEMVEFFPKTTNK